MEAHSRSNIKFCEGRGKTTLQPGPRKYGVSWLFFSLFVSILLFAPSCGLQSEKISKITSLVAEAYGIIDDSVYTKDMIYEGRIEYFDFHGMSTAKAEFVEYFKHPGKLRIDMTFESKFVTDSWDGIFAMEKSGRSKAVKISPKRFVTSLRIKSFPYKFLNETFKFAVETDELIGKDSCYVLSGRFRGHDVVKYYVDKRLGVLRKYEGRSHFGAPGWQEIHFKKYRLVDGSFVAEEIEYSINGRKYKKRVIEKIYKNTGIDDMQFNLVKNSVFI